MKKPYIGLSKTITQNYYHISNEIFSMTNFLIIKDIVRFF